MNSITMQQAPQNGLTAADRQKYQNYAYWLAVFTIVYNVIEGVIATWFGYQDETLTLLGFGIDSFIETISGIGILHMIIRMKQQSQADTDFTPFEITALKITGTAFYLLTVGLLASAVVSIYTGHQPQNTTAGVIVSGISIAVMWAMIIGKEKVGHALESKPILADAQCSRVCIYMSFILLVSSALYQLFAIPYIDIIGTLGLAFFSFKEGRECFEKATTKRRECSGNCCH